MTLSLRRTLALVLATAVASLAAAPAGAQGRLEATYRATLGGVTIGNGRMVADLGKDRYSVRGTGESAGLMKALGGGSGEASAQGAISGHKVHSTSYQHAIRSKQKLQAITMLLAAGAVKSLAVEPPVDHDDKRTPLTDAHKHGVVDPLSAGLIPAAGAGGVGPEACSQKLPVFDGRLRFDLKLAYKRTEPISAEGLSGTAVVCRVTFEPLGGHVKERFAIRFLRENRDMEAWFAPIAGTGFLAPVRIYVPTLLGPAVLQVTRFVVASAPRGAEAKTQ